MVDESIFADAGHFVSLYSHRNGHIGSVGIDCQLVLHLGDGLALHLCGHFTHAADVEAHGQLLVGLGCQIRTVVDGSKPVVPVGAGIEVSVDAIVRHVEHSIGGDACEAAVQHVGYIAHVVDRLGNDRVLDGHLLQVGLSLEGTIAQVLQCRGQCDGFQVLESDSRFEGTGSHGGQTFGQLNFLNLALRESILAYGGYPVAVSYGRHNQLAGQFAVDGRLYGFVVAILVVLHYCGCIDLALWELGVAADDMVLDVDTLCISFGEVDVVQNGYEASVGGLVFALIVASLDNNPCHDGECGLGLVGNVCLYVCIAALGRFSFVAFAPVARSYFYLAAVATDLLNFPIHVGVGIL